MQSENRQSGGVHMSSYVIVGLHRERCRARDPKKCRYHVGPDGKPLEHYPDVRSADAALVRAREAASRPLVSGAASVGDSDSGQLMDASRDPGTGAGVGSHDGLDDLDLFVIDADDVLSRTDDAEGLDVRGGDSSSLDVTVPTLNRMREDAAVDSAQREVASMVVSSVRAAMSDSGEWHDRLAWTASGSPVQWPEWWSTRSTMTAYEPNDVEYVSSVQSIARWSFDYCSDGEFSTEDRETQVGLYDAVRAGKLTWQDLRDAGAKTCWMQAVSVGGGSAGEPHVKTALTWCGRKPKATSGDGPVVGDENMDCGRSCGTLKAMMESLEDLAVGMSQAEIEIHVSR